MYTYLGKWIMVNNSKCECPFLPAHPRKFYSFPSHQFRKPSEVSPGGFHLGVRGTVSPRGLWHGLHSGLALPGPCPAEIMYRLLGLRPVLRGPRPHNTALWLPKDGQGLHTVPPCGKEGFCS